MSGFFSRAIAGRKTVTSAARCGDCRHFRNDPAYLEAAIPGLSSFSSGAASVRADDGLCLRHDLFLGAGRRCDQFELASPATKTPAEAGAVGEAGSPHYSQTLTGRRPR